MVRWGAVGVVVLGLWACDDGGGSGGEDPAPDQAVVDGAVADAGEADARPDAGPAPDAAAPVDAAPADAEPPPDAEVPDAAPPKACDDALGVIPPGLTVLQHDDGVPVGDVTEQPWEIVGVRVGTSELHEAVRFELERPARIHAIQVQYGLLPDGRETPVTLGLYPDFGHNGFDFWAADPYWEGGRCRGDLRSEQWVDYVLPAPIEITEPGLVYVAHRREARRSAAWLFDGSLPTPDCGNDCCNAFANCHSAWNFPTLTQFQSGGQANYAYNGLSTTFPYDYLVRLHVEYLDEPAAEPVFAALPDVAPSNRMAFADVDNDGDDDLLTNGPRLLRNDGGTFVDATEAAGLAGKRGSGVFGDFDNDGCLDLFLFDESYTGPDSLLRGDCQGGFEDVTEASGITDVQAYNSCLDKGNRSPTAAAAWVDLDADGFLDLYLSNFICWDDGTVYVDTVWHSNGDGTFTEWTGQHGFGDQDDPYLAGRGVLPVDADGDGDMDVFVNNYRLQQNLYYRNEGDGTFTEAAMEAGLAGRATQQGAQTWYGHSIGAAFGDLDGDGDLDAIVANLAHPRFWDFSSKTEVLINQGDGTFADIQGAWDFPAGAAGLRYQETHSVPALADFDQDGALDLVISAVYDGRPTDFYWGNGDGTFRLDAWRSGIGVTNGWGHATADVDLDGDVDLAAQGAVYLNQRAHAGHWLQVKVVGDVAANRAALGATVTVEAGGRRFVRFVGGGTGQGCQDSLYLHMGLGEAASVDRISVRFPGAAAPVVFAGPFDADQRLWLYESGNVQRGFAP
ncbi:MAG: CRTAC1 family protein [Myxococcales bacterium]|nr:CRTAC1 family protein [Myxococcales bacterium]